MDEGGSLLQKLRGVFEENGDKGKLAEEMVEKIEEGYEKGVLTKREMRMICNIFDYMDKDAKDIMTHRKQIVALDGEKTVAEAFQFIVQQNYSRLPVFEEEIDNIIGMIHLRDAMKCYVDESLRNVPIKDLKEYIRPVSFIPETRNIDKLLLQMQKNKMHMAIVIDEYGQTSGLVTMENIIEVIVGNIQDEYDNEEEKITKQADNTYMVDGTTQLDELEDLLSIKFDEEDFDTINGYLVNCLDHIPQPGETCAVQFDGYTFEVKQVDRKMIKKVRISKNA